MLTKNLPSSSWFWSLTEKQTGTASLRGSLGSWRLAVTAETATHTNITAFYYSVSCRACEWPYSLRKQTCAVAASRRRAWWSGGGSFPIVGVLRVDRGFTGANVILSQAEPHSPCSAKPMLWSVSNTLVPGVHRRRPVSFTLESPLL